jgi:opacity protein-like surface antigen
LNTIFCLALLGPAVVAVAEDEPTGNTATLADPGNRWHLSTGFGAGSVSGGYGEFLDVPYHYELGLAKELSGGQWRIGGGLQFGSMKMKPPYQDQKEWAHLETFGSATRLFGPWGRVRPYLQGRVGIVRIHPRSEIFYNKDPEGLEPGESPTKAVNGVGLTALGGVEIGIRPGLALDVSGYWTGYRTGEYDLSPIGMDPVSDGNDLGVKVLLAWQPLAGHPMGGVAVPVLFDPVTGEALPLPPPSDYRDAWGVPRSWGWAWAQMLGINFGASMFNEYVRDANFNQISPRSFWHNLEEGFTWDDNKFKTNQLIHPFNGSTYFNSARANGIDFWGSSAMAIAGAFTWEAFGETHPMSWNDMVSTGLGGIARGEMVFRVSSLILDNTARGKGRFGRELAAFVVNPVRGFNRLVSGDAREVKGNPSNPQDWIPPDLGVTLRMGPRVMGEGESITENVKYFGFAEVAIAYGSPWKNERRRPYDRFDVVAAMNFGDKVLLGRLLIRGDILSIPLGDGETHTFALQQDFDYIDNEAYEWGGQSFAAALQSRFRVSEKHVLVSRLQGIATVLGAVNSDLAFLADVADRERYREYDYGPGLGVAWELYLRRNDRPFLSARYRYNYLNVSNGSIYHDPESNAGLNTDHDIHQGTVALDVPVSEWVAVGADASVFLRSSHYDIEGTEGSEIEPGVRTVTQRNPEVRLYLGLQW